MGSDMFYGGDGNRDAISIDSNRLPRLLGKLIASRFPPRVADGGLVGGGVDFANQRAKLLEDVVDGLDQAGAVADQAVAAAAGQAVHRAGHGEDLPVLLHGMVSGGQRAAPRRGFDDHDAQAKAGNDPVALGKQFHLA